MLTIEDLQNVIVLVNRSSYRDLAEAKAGLVIEAHAKQALEAAQNPSPINAPEGTQPE